MKPEMTENARTELTYHLAANPTVQSTTEAYLHWMAWCLGWNEMSLQEATTALDYAIARLSQTKDYLASEAKITPIQTTFNSRPSKANNLLSDA